MGDPPRAGRSLRNKLQDGEPIRCHWLSLGSPAAAEIAALNRPDALVFDCQHGLWQRNTLEWGIGLVRGHSTPLVRVASIAAGDISQALDAGAEGIIAPLIESTEQARQLVAHCHYPPKGERSGGGLRPLHDWPTYQRHMAAGPLICAMIETAAGAAQAEAIAAVPGLDLIFVGSGDLALSVGEFPQQGKAFADALQQILKACQQAQLPCGIYTPTAEAAQTRLQEGFQLVVQADDAALLRSGFAAPM